MQTTSHKSESAKRQVVQTAQAMLLEEGARSFSMRKLANRLGWTAGNLYYYFTDKQALLQEIATIGHREMAEVIARADREDRPADERFLHTLTAYMDWVLENQTMFFLMTTQPETKQQTDVLQSGAAPHRTALQRMISLVEHGTAEGVFACEEAALSCQVVWASTYGLLFRLCTEQTPEPYRTRLIKRHGEMMLRALGAEKERKR